MPTTTNRRRNASPASATARSARPAARRPGTKDAIAVIKADHSAVATAMRSYETFSPTALKRKRATAERIIRDLSIHAAIEEELLYPAARKRLSNGAALVIIGLTGSPAQVAQVKKSFGIFSQKVGTGDTYTVDHTATVLLFDKDGRFQSTISPDETDPAALAKLRRLTAG